MRRNILITGATSGMGLALASRLAPRHQVFATGRMTNDEAAEILPPSIRYVQAPQTDPVKCAEQLLKGLRRSDCDGLHNAVLNAGTGFVGDPAKEDVARIRETLDVNLAATVALSHSLLPLIAKKRGRLTLIGSVAHKGAANFASYAASKAGLAGFARALRSEWKGRVDVQMIHPGPVATGMHQKAGHDPGRLGALFIHPTSMGAMLEHAISRGRSPKTLSFVSYFGGESVFGRRL